MSHPETAAPAAEARAAILDGRTALGIELGSTRIKACLIGTDGGVLAVGGHEWENELVDGLWTYSLDAVRDGLRAAYAELASDAERRHGARPETIGAIGVSAMMHGYLAFDAAGELLVPFRTWRNVNTERAAAELSEALACNIPLRWSVAHLHQAVLDDEEHVARIAHLNTLAGHVHELLTGERVLGVGDASGMFPIDPATGDYDEALIRIADERLAAAGAPHLRLRELLPTVLPAGAPAGALTDQGAALLDPTGSLRAGAPLCPPEGDAGTGMVATNAVTPRTGNVSAGTSIFAMVVLERALSRPYPEIDVVTTPAGDPVAMVHCNNGASELGAWAGVFGEFAAAIGSPATGDDVFAALLRGALEAGADDGLLAYNHLAGEPIAELLEGRPLFVRTPGSRLTLGGFFRAQLRGVFATLSLGMRTLADEGVAIDAMCAHGGVFRTAGVAQRLLAAAVEAPVVVGETAGEGGAWGMAVLAAYARAVADGAAAGRTLAAWLADAVFAGAATSVAEPTAEEIADHRAYLDRWAAGLAAERAAVAAIR
ncbi:ATPase [Microbacterium sp. MEC084]|uniref:FGGY-family carbohydrate kinase n=1 Tax=unclassified Microbacterium TaxID=2609290 RepID=UPI0006F33750|nr:MULTISPECIES: FGGY-family carbohydrate kinase [unclassified Microbacterium]KQY98719.1 ATPase [Microbacterium sp. Root53]MCD1268677.1 ATPase [Microbacterium sp. MEC084]